MLLLVSISVAIGGACRKESASSAAAVPPTVVSAPTFNRDIAPILYDNCIVCHRTGQAVPFTLLQYSDAKERADKIAKATAAHEMPPWLPERGDHPFVGERRLTDAEIQTIQRWAKQGAPEGHPADMPKRPVFAEGWQLGKPDLIVRIPRAYVLRPGKEDIFRNVVMRVALPSVKYVRAIEFHPGAAPVVHHAVISIDRTRASRRRDGADGEPGYDGMIVQDAQSPDGHFLGWTPGRGPIVSPAGMPWRLDRGSDIVVQLHLLPQKQPVAVQPELGLFFSDAPPVHSPVMVKLASKAIDIPAGARDYAIADSYVLPVDVDVLSLYPHAHYLGHTMQAVATLPDGTTTWLLRIGKWSFHWQQDYRYVTPIALPRGTKISMRYTYDNSADNEDNPHKPPGVVRYGPKSTDEMGDLWIQVLPHTDADAAVLARDFATREALLNVAGAEMAIAHDPDSAATQTFLGSSYAAVGRIAEAIPHLQLALRLDPNSAGAHNYLGGALAAQGKLTDAIAQFREAARLSPQDERMHFNLGNALAAAGQAEEAARAFERAIAVNPDFAPAHENLGVYLESRGKLGEAIVHLRRAVDLAPESASAHSDLGAALGEAGKIDEALGHIRRALELDPTYAPARENLARLSKGRL